MFSLIELENRVEFVLVSVIPVYLSVAVTLFIHIYLFVGGIIVSEWKLKIMRLSEKNFDQRVWNSNLKKPKTADVLGEARRL